MYTVAWKIENQVLLVELSQEVTGNDIKNLNDHIMRQYLDSSPNEIHLIVVGSNITKLPSNIAEVAKASKDFANHPKLGMSVYVDMLNPLIAFLANVATQIVGQPYKMTKTVDEAMAVLEKLGKIKTS